MPATLPAMSERRFATALTAARTALHRSPLARPGISRIVEPEDRDDAVRQALGPYRDGARVRACEAIANVPTTDWRTVSNDARKAALIDGGVLPAWLEGFDPARTAARN